MCRKLGVSLIVGYLVVGAVIGVGGLGLVSDKNHEIEHLAEVGVLLLLFSIGLEFSLDEIREWVGRFFIGGSVQMLLVAIPIALGLHGWGMSWQPAVLLASALAFSSTVLVFKALSEIGVTNSAHGRSAIAILLFQDASLVPLLLFAPLLMSEAGVLGAADGIVLALKSVLFIAGVIVLRRLIARVGVPLVISLRNTELTILFVLALFVSVSLIAHFLGLPAVLGAFVAGLVLSGNRITRQIDALVLPFRESFAAVFFVSLGMLLKPGILWNEAGFLLLALAGIVTLKTAAAAVSLRLTGSRWAAAFGMGLGLSQVGEFSFVLALQGLHSGIITEDLYQRILCLSLATLLLTPQLLKVGLRLASTKVDTSAGTSFPALIHETSQAVVIGIGPAGRQIASRLELAGYQVCVVDLSPVNTHPFEQQGFHAVSGDATDPKVLRRAGVEHADLAVVSVPDDDVSLEIVKNLRSTNRGCQILSRCRFLSNTTRLRNAGADVVVSEEAEAVRSFMKVLDERFDLLDC